MVAAARARGRGVGATTGATNLWPLAPVSFGESWHNMHHSYPAWARRGAEPGQIDISAAVIHLFERLGWATGVHWPVQDEPQPAPTPEDAGRSGQ